MTHRIGRNLEHRPRWRVRIAYHVRKRADAIIRAHHESRWIKGGTGADRTCDESCPYCGYECGDCGSPR